MQEEDTNKNYYYFVCHKIITDLHGDIQKNITYCMKLIRNLGHYSYNTDYFDPTFERCNILYNWLYHSSKSEKIPDTIIEKCFDDYNFQIRGITSNYKCSYDLYKNMYLEPIKINILNLFDNNIQIIRQILIGRDDSKKTLCRKFVCECVNIYKHMSNTYCPNGKAKQKDYSNTCSKLYDFKQSYTLLHSNGGLSNLNIPSLDYIDRDFITKCPADEQKKVLRLHEVSTLQPAIGNRLKADAGDPTNSLEGVTTSATEDNSMKKHITTTIGTVAGASSLLAFLYKVRTYF
ncbi:hypothetical protein PVMG_04528 [Plasmodium vivax Mauritania I]|uniref:Uncharacterized protein n=2 Tax=Plasmodium vivax TaxID=5855 RepID=A0A0J9VQQ5_PLAVI|nr:hypothetical protein PVBG_04768 [Plasmodium vivax Brazil I]KMZ89698.1 hypothetical protein PVMG_04528 [Plasmodium vivax Mauritania I]